MYADDHRPGSMRITRQVMWDFLPQLRPQILEYEERNRVLWEDVDPHLYMGDYGYMTDVFWNQLFEPLLEASDENGDQLRECSIFLEEMLTFEDLTEMVGIRVTHMMLKFPHLWRRFRPYAGPLMRKDIQESAQYFIWPYPEPVV